MSKDLDEIIPQIISGEMTEYQAAEILARRSNVEAKILLPTIATRVRYARAYGEIKQSRTVYSTSPGKVQSSSSSSGGTDKVPPSKFMEVMLRAGLTKKQAAEAIGRSVSRVHELTVTQGGKQHLFDTFVQALESYGGQAGSGNGESGRSPAGSGESVG